MRQAALERKKGLDVEWGERGIERRPPTAEGINAARPLPPIGGGGGGEGWRGGGFIIGCKGDEQWRTRERELPLLF